MQQGGDQGLKLGDTCSVDIPIPNSQVMESSKQVDMGHILFSIPEREGHRNSILGEEVPIRLSVKGYTRQSSYLASQAGGYEASNLSQNQSPSVCNYMMDGEDIDFFADIAGGESYQKQSRSPEPYSMGRFTQSPQRILNLFDLEGAQLDGNQEMVRLDFTVPKHGPHAAHNVNNKRDKRVEISPNCSFSSRGDGSVGFNQQGLQKIKEEASYQDDGCMSGRYEQSQVNVASARSCRLESVKDSGFKRSLKIPQIDHSLGSDEKSERDPKDDLFHQPNQPRGVLSSARSAGLITKPDTESGQFSLQKTTRALEKKPLLTSGDLPVVHNFENLTPKATDTRDNQGQSRSPGSSSNKDALCLKKNKQPTLLDSDEPEISNLEQLQNLRESNETVLIASMRPIDEQQIERITAGKQKSVPEFEQSNSIAPSLKALKKRFLEQTNRMQKARTDLIKNGMLKPPRESDEILFQETNIGEFRISNDQNTATEKSKGKLQYSFANSPTKKQNIPMNLTKQASPVQIHINNNHASNIIINTTTLAEGSRQQTLPRNSASIGIDIFIMPEGNSRHTGDACQPQSNQAQVEVRASQDRLDPQVQPVETTEDFQTHSDKKYLLNSISKPGKKKPVKPKPAEPKQKPSHTSQISKFGPNSRYIEGISLRRDSSQLVYKSFASSNKASKSTDQLERYKPRRPKAEMSEDHIQRVPGDKDAAVQHPHLHHPDLGPGIFSSFKSAQIHLPAKGILTTPEKTRYLPGLEDAGFSPSSRMEPSTAKFTRVQPVDWSPGANSQTRQGWTASRNPTSVTSNQHHKDKSTGPNPKWAPPVTYKSKRSVWGSSEDKASNVMSKENLSASWGQQFYQHWNSLKPGQPQQHNQNVSNEVTISSNWSNTAVIGVVSQGAAQEDSVSLPVKHVFPVAGLRNQEASKDSSGAIGSKKSSRFALSPVCAHIDVESHDFGLRGSKESPLLSQPLISPIFGLNHKGKESTNRKPTNKTVSQVATNSNLNLFRDTSIFKNTKRT